MNAVQSHRHHYVPQWYQKRFIASGKDVLCYLDLKPELVTSGEHSYRKKALKYWHPVKC